MTNKAILGLMMMAICACDGAASDETGDAGGYTVLDCAPAPAGSCGPLQPSFGWVCSPETEPPYDSCQPAAVPVEGDGAATWCCDEPCAPSPAHDDECADDECADDECADDECADDEDRPSYYSCQPAPAYPSGCAPLTGLSVCCSP